MREYERRHRTVTSLPSAPATFVWIVLPGNSGNAAALFKSRQIRRHRLDGPFLFDDQYLPYGLPEASPHLHDWLIGVRITQKAPKRQSGPISSSLLPSP